MIALDEIKTYLKQSLSDKRFKHSLNVADKALELAERFGGASQKAYIAGLVHDCTRELSLTEQHSMLNELKISVDPITSGISELLHAHTAEFLLKNKFDINDEEIISAVKFHTTAKEDMTLLEKIIFLSDVIEPSRSFPGVLEIRQLSKQDIDMAMIAALDSSIKFLIAKRALIHPNTIYARNFLVKVLL